VGLSFATVLLVGVVALSLLFFFIGRFCQRKILCLID
jgi:hypothetical protein